MAMTYAQTAPTLRQHDHPAAVAFANTSPRAFARSPFGKSPFGGFVPETSRRSELPQRQTDPKLERIMDAWKTVNIDSSVFDSFMSASKDHDCLEYKRVFDAVKGVHCSSADLDRFVSVLVALQEEPYFQLRAGLFLSALVNDSPEGTCTIQAESFLWHPIHYLGFFNKKKLIIEGSAGDYLGWRMTRGTIVVNVSAGRKVGGLMRGGHIVVQDGAGSNAGYFMERGRVTINGNAGLYAGYAMRGGRLTIRGNTDDLAGSHMRGGVLNLLGNSGETVGDQMSGGEIHVNGRYKSISHWIYGGQVFIGGRDVVRARRGVV